MALSRFERARLYSSPPFQPDVMLLAEESVHIRVYRAFVALARIAAIGIPVAVALVLFWAK